MDARAPRELVIGMMSVAALILAGTAARGGDHPASAGPEALAAIATCQRSDAALPDERAALLADGLARAERAVAANPQDAAAHFAVFCNLGKSLMHCSTWKLFGALGDLRRVRNEIDIALSLAPDYAPALAGKGAMIAELPRVLGGDKQEGARLLMRAVALSPRDAKLRLALAEVLKDVGELDAARAHASTAVGILEHAGAADDLSSARAIAASVQ
jgi:hypothetical protein